MQSAAASTSVKRQIDEVFATIVDFDRMSSWVDGLHDVVQVSPGPVDVGSAFSAKLNFRGKTRPFHFTITNWEPPHSFGLGTRRGSLPFETTVYLTPVDGGATRIEKTISSAGGVGARLLTKALKPILSRAVRREIDALERMLDPQTD